MSHVTTIELAILDLASLKAAAEALGLEFREGQKTYRWYGRHVGDYPLPEGFKVEDLGKCEHALAVKGVPGAYEVGVVKARKGEGYTLLWDFWAGGKGLETVVGKDAMKLQDRYAAEVSVKLMRKKGYSATIQTTATGLKVLCKK